LREFTRNKRARAFSGNCLLQGNHIPASFFGDGAIFSPVIAQSAVLIKQVIWH
jgi:hypothetical protein